MTVFVFFTFMLPYINRFLFK